MHSGAELAVTVAAILALTGCAAGGHSEPPAEIDMDKIREVLNCPPDRTPTCTQHIGRNTRCFCADSEAMQELLEPDRQP